MCAIVPALVRLTIDCSKRRTCFDDFDAARICLIVGWDADDRVIAWETIDRIRWGGRGRGAKVDVVAPQINCPAFDSGSTLRPHSHATVYSIFRSSTAHQHDNYVIATSHNGHVVFPFKRCHPR